LREILLLHDLLESCIIVQMDTFVIERQAHILTQLQAHGRVSAHDLARFFRISEDSVRRDLREMAARGECERVYGGAVLATGETVPLRTRIAQAADRKAKLGRAAAECLPEGSVVFFDAGSTNLAIARSLPEGFRLTAVTNTPAIAAELAGRAGIELVMIGGRIDPAVGAAIDAMAVRQVEAIRPDLCLLGACGLTLDHGLAADVFEDAAFKRLVSAASRRSLAAVTTDKLGHAAAFHVHDLKAPLSLVVEEDADAALIEIVAARGVDVQRVSQSAIKRENSKQEK
jgi:DeoR/GlpR family transcriptional regulator of sugar metabolism